MNESINLTKILKDCPKGWKLWSPIFGVVEFEKILESKGVVIVDVGNGESWTFNSDATFPIGNLKSVEIMLYPSRENRDWSKFTAPRYKKEGDTIAWLEKQRDKDKLIQELGEYKVKYTQEVLEKYINSMSNKDDERLRKTAIAFLKDFAEQGYENAIECIDWLEKQGKQASPQTNKRAWLYLVSDILTWKDGIGQYLDDPRVQELAKRLCSKYAQKLYNPSILFNSSSTGKNKQKFDPKILQPFDKVLVKNDYNPTSIWYADFVSYRRDIDEIPVTMYDCMTPMVIPYNEETKHLCGTSDDAPKYYRYWED